MTYSFSIDPVFMKTHFLSISMISVSFNLQMEKEIKELKSQRDLAQSRLQNLLQTVGDHAKHSVNLLP